MHAYKHTQLYIDQKQSDITCLLQRLNITIFDNSNTTILFQRELAI